MNSAFGAHQIEPELLAHPPRTAHLTKAARIARLFGWNALAFGVLITVGYGVPAAGISAALLLVPPLALAAGIGLWRRECRRDLDLLEHGTATVGTVVKRFMVDESSSTTRYYLRCSFSPDGGATRRECEARVSSVIYAHYEAGDELTVLFDPAHPTEAVPYDAITRARLSAAE